MTFIEEAIISSFIGETISRCTDASWMKIKEVVKDKKNMHQNIESQIYNVIVNVLNQMTYNKFENDQDKIYQAAEKLLMGYKDGRCDNIEVVRSGLKILDASVNSDKYVEFKMQLYQEISKSDYEELYHQIRLLQQDEESNITSRIEEKVDKIQESVDETNRRLNAFQENNRGKDNIQNIKAVKSRTQEYADKWNANMFLNDFNKRDQKAGVNVKLREVYLEEHLPHYIWGDNDNVSDDLRDLLFEYINEKKNNKMLLVLGQPGSGKSTLVTWITANFSYDADDLLVYRFASDLNNIDWKSNDVPKRILETLGLMYDDLNGKTLILEGFDEINVVGDRKDILDKIYWELIKRETLKNFSLIITCRENYIGKFERIRCTYIILQPWDEVQIKSFCKIFLQKTKGEISANTIDKLIENKEILGVPLILYMVLALNISIEKEGSIVDVYDKIFSLEGGIYDRCIDNKMFEDKHRIGEIKMQVHQISREIAIWMFENNSARAYIPKEEYQKICVNIMQKQQQNKVDKQQDFLIGNYFRLVKYCEGIDTEELYFVHRSIYEYFVVETIYSSIEDAIRKLTVESQEELAGNIAFWLKQGRITNTIGEYLQFKLLKLYNGFDCEKKEIFYEWWEETFNKMISNGMFYYTEGNMQDYKNIIDKEINCFLNLMKILRLLFGIGRKKYILENANKIQLEKYIRFRLAKCRIEERSGTEIFNLGRVSLEDMNLSGADIKMANLSNANLKGTNLSETDLSKLNFQDMDLRGADLEDTNLQNVDFRGADLREVNLVSANLQETIFDERQVDYLMDKYNLDNSKVYICNEKKVISYASYCKRINNR